MQPHHDPACAENTQACGLKTLWHIFCCFLLLGCTSFGGPAAHIGYFRTTFVRQMGWLSETEYARLVALSQFLPGPGSSQVGFALGLQRAGLAGGLAAFIGFTLPSFVLMTALAIGAASVMETASANAVLHGLKLLAVVVVADAVIAMAGSFCQNTQQKVWAVIIATLLLVLPASTGVQILLLLAAGVYGGLFQRPAHSAPATHTPLNVRWPALLIWIGLLGMALWPGLLPRLFSDFYSSGSLVFGGGHVVLPLLQERLSDSASQDTLLLGYAAAQAVPGPMFTLASFLGASLGADWPLMAALIATLAIFLPGLLLVYALLPGWQVLAQRARISGALNLINAGVVGILGAALLDPIALSAITGRYELVAAGLGLFVLRQWRPPIVVMVLAAGLTGWGQAWV